MDTFDTLGGMSRTFLVSLVFLFLALAGARSAVAVLITPGTGTALAGAVPPAGAILDTMSNPFTLLDNSNPSQILATGVVDSSVVHESATGLLRFEYQLTVDTGSPGNVDFLIGFNFSDFTTDVDFLPGTGGIAPTSATRSPLSVAGAAVSFFFPGSGAGGGLMPGETSRPLFVRTNATEFDLNGLVRVQQNLDIENLFDAFGPSKVTQIPQPPPIALMCAGLLAMCFSRWRSA